MSVTVAITLACITAILGYAAGAKDNDQTQERERRKDRLIRNLLNDVENQTIQYEEGMTPEERIQLLKIIVQYYRDLQKAINNNER